ncbi:MAG: adenylate/guanylate cyclase domain-containing protein [bacterium]
MEKQKIIVIDDEVDIARLLVEELEAAGFSSSFADNGEEGMEKVRKEKPDLLLLDWKLPDMEGIDICRILKSEEETEYLPIIMLTAQSSEKDKIKGFEAGAEDYVTKPFSSGELLARIRGILRRVKKRDKVVEKEVAKLQKYMPKNLIEKILSAKKMEGERRNVTVLLGDISGFTKMSEKMDPEEVQTMMNECFKFLVSVIYKYEGTVDKFMGDAVMAIFGAPIAHEDDPQRAVKAGIEMQSKLEEFNGEKKSEAPLKMRIGINSGMVVAGSVGSDMRMDYTVMGDTVNLTARLETAAEPGQILISESTYARVTDDFEFEKLPPVQVKGKEEPVQPYRVKGIKMEAKKKIRAVEGLEISKFVGRDREFGILKKVVDKLFSEQPLGSVVSVFGDTGIGKSRLIYELNDYIKEKGVTFLKGRGLTYGPTLKYLVFREMLSSLFGIDNEEEEVGKSKVKEMVKTLNMDEADSVPLLKFMGLKCEAAAFDNMDAEGRKRKTFEVIRNLFLKASEVKPLFFLFENLRWTDPDSRELLNYLIDGIGQNRILIVCIYRRGFEHKWGDKIYYREMELVELTPANLNDIISSVMVENKLSGDLKEKIIVKSEGNPFFLEEIIKSLMDKKILERVEGKWVNRKEVETIEVPESVGAVIMTRLDGLSEDEKKFLQIASCAGKSFKYKVVAPLCGEEDKLKAVVLNLKNKDIIVEKSVYPEREYEFKQDIVRDVMYSSLLLSRRKELEEKIGN